MPNRSDITLYLVSKEEGLLYHLIYSLHERVENGKWKSMQQYWGVLIISKRLNVSNRLKHVTWYIGLK